MFNNDWILLQLARDRHSDLLRKAAQERLSRELIRQPSRLARGFSWLGRQLIMTGERLQTYHKAAVTTAALRSVHHGR
jgi:hypothetical protein